MWTVLLALLGALLGLPLSYYFQAPLIRKIPLSEYLRLLPQLLGGIDRKEVSELGIPPEAMSVAIGSPEMVVLATVIACAVIFAIVGCLIDISQSHTAAPHSGRYEDGGSAYSSYNSYGQRPAAQGDLPMTDNRVQWEPQQFAAAQTGFNSPPPPVINDSSRWYGEQKKKLFENYMDGKITAKQFNEMRGELERLRAETP